MKKFNEGATKKDKRMAIILSLILAVIVVIIILIQYYPVKYGTGGLPEPEFITSDEFVERYNAGEFEIGLEIGVYGDMEQSSGNSTIVNFTIDGNLNLSCSVSNWQTYTNWVDDGGEIRESDYGIEHFQMECMIEITEDSYEFKYWGGQVLISTER